MRAFKYNKTEEGLLIPDEKNGKIIVYVDNWLVKAFEGNKEITDLQFYVDNEERILINRIKEINPSVNILPALAYPNKERKIRLNQLLGKVFEDYVYSILSRKYSVERNKEIYSTIKGVSLHNKPDFIVENKIAIEAKVRESNLEQVTQYAKKFKYGAIVFPYSGKCRVPKNWICLFYLMKDYNRLYKWIDLHLLD